MKYLKQYEKFENLLKYSKLIRDYFDYTKVNHVKIDPFLVYKGHTYTDIYFNKKTRDITVRDLWSKKPFDPILDGTMLLIKLYIYLTKVTPEIIPYQKMKKKIDKFNL